VCVTVSFALLEEPSSLASPARLLCTLISSAASHNQLAEVPASLGALTGLLTLRLEANCLTTAGLPWPALAALTGLTLVRPARSSMHESQLDPPLLTQRFLLFRLNPHPVQRAHVCKADSWPLWGASAQACA
jgi:hypothetical protein